MSALLSLRNVSKRYRGLLAVNDVSLDIEQGSITSIVGPNGAGKSTLFNLISNYVRPTAGAVRFQKTELTRLAPHQICQLGISRAFQIAKPFPQMTVAENLMVAASFGKSGPRDPRAVVRRVIDVCALGDIRDSVASVLSVGHLRRLELARALAARPVLLLADEPFAGLNETETANLLGVVEDIRAEGVTILLVEHDIKAVRRVSDRVIVLEAGAKIADGDADTVFSLPQVIEAYLGRAA